MFSKRAPPKLHYSTGSKQNILIHAKTPTKPTTQLSNYHHHQLLSQASQEDNLIAKQHQTNLTQLTLPSNEAPLKQ